MSHRYFINTEIIEHFKEVSRDEYKDEVLRILETGVSRYGDGLARLRTELYARKPELLREENREALAERFKSESQINALDWCDGKPENAAQTLSQPPHTMDDDELETDTERHDRIVSGLIAKVKEVREGLLPQNYKRQLTPLCGYIADESGSKIQPECDLVLP